MGLQCGQLQAGREKHRSLLRPHGGGSHLQGHLLLWLSWPAKAPVAPCLSPMQRG